MQPINIDHFNDTSTPGIRMISSDESPEKIATGNQRNQVQDDNDDDDAEKASIISSDGTVDNVVESSSQRNDQSDAANTSVEEVARKPVRKFGCLYEKLVFL